MQPRPKLFGLADCGVTPAHQFLLVDTRGRTVALVVDAVAGTLDGVDAGMKVADTLLPGCSYLGDRDGQAAGMITVLDLDTLLAAAGVQLPADPGAPWGVDHAAA